MPGSIALRLERVVVARDAQHAHAERDDAVGRRVAEGRP
jgi:hypothetical protein